MFSILKQTFQLFFYYSNACLRKVFKKLFQFPTRTNLETALVSEYISNFFLYENLYIDLNYHWYEPNTLSHFLDQFL